MQDQLQALQEQLREQQELNELYKRQRKETMQAIARDIEIMAGLAAYIKRLEGELTRLGYTKQDGKWVPRG